ncbi:RuvB-like protein 1 [Fistulifera solaris]|uniref:RuvB-like helicase n=1 Tax=Fistulifera solaris TaxID=1519565 RepID=A0A1Z5JW76_FISSO|nr:RuvB-like protein 1 [Fistulifera solaris]|eukprot:GAX17981.1 RuvB-like protein 1 [Fistulifera solaris]
MSDAPKRPPVTLASNKNKNNSGETNRIAAHSHIRGLDGDACGLTGQTAAREALSLWADLIQKQRVAGRALMLVGPPGSGKTALALALAKQLGPSVPFCALAASRVYSQEVSATAVLAEHFRQAMGLRIRETKEVYEGEVTELTVQETQDALQAYGRTISHVVLTLKTTKGTKTLQLDPTMYDALQKEKVVVGDVIYIEANSGAVKRVGRSDSFATEFDLEAEEYVALPKGEVHKKRQVVQDVTLHDLDVANAHPSAGPRDVSTLLSSLQKPKKTEITDKLRQEINKVVQKYIADGVAEFVPGVLFLDEVHMLDLEAFTFLHRSLESPLSPILVLATNRGMTQIRNADGLISPHGIPADFLDRLLIVPTRPYEAAELQQILSTRAQTEQLKMQPEALDLLTQIGVRTSLRFAVQLLTPAMQLAKVRGLEEIDAAAVQSVDSLFWDGKTSAQFLQKQQ